MAATLTRLGQLATLQGRYHTAHKRYNEALDMLHHNSAHDDSGGHDSNDFVSENVAQVLALLGQCYAQQQQQTEHSRHPSVSSHAVTAVDYLDQAVRGMRAVGQTTPYHAMEDGAAVRERHLLALQQMVELREACVASCSLLRMESTNDTPDPLLMRTATGACRTRTGEDCALGE